MLKEFAAEAILAFKKEMVKFPEFPVRASKLRCFRGGLLMGMYFVQREIPKYEAQALAKVFLNALDDRIGMPAMGAFVVAILDQSEGSVFVALDVIRRTTGHLQCAHRILLCRQALDGLKYHA